MKTKLLLLSLMLTSTVAMTQVVANQVDDFEDGTTQTWEKGAGAPPEEQPMNIATGGPAGADDNYLEFSSNGMAGLPSSKMVVFSTGGSQWTSDFTTAGIVAIKMDVNVSINDLNLRVAFQGSGTRMSTTNAVTVPAGSGWTSITIPIAPSDFTVVQGSLTPAGVLANVQVMRILSSEVPAWGGNDVNDIVATLGLDNITASTTLSTQDLNTPNGFEISPNPATSKMNVKLAEAFDNANITVYNVLGKKVYSKSITAMTSTIDVSKWNTGVYLVRISSDKQTITKRFVKQ